MNDGSHIMTASRNGNDMQVFFDNIQSGSKNTTITGANQSIQNFGQASSAANSTGGEMQEMIHWNVNQSSSREAITQGVNQYYGIY